MKSRKELKQLAQDNYADYMMSDPFDEDFMSSYSDSLTQLSSDEKEIYDEVSEELRNGRLEN